MLKKCKENQDFFNLKIEMWKASWEYFWDMHAKVQEALPVIPCGVQVDGLPHAASIYWKISQKWAYLLILCMEFAENCPELRKNM